MKRYLNIIGFAVILALFAHVSILRPAVADDGRYWTVASVAGAAEFKSANGAWQPLRKDSRVDVGHLVRTGSDGRVLLSRGDEAVTISHDSSFAVLPAKDGILTRIFQKAGALMFKVQKRPGKHFEVQTPYLVAAVKGTTFTVDVDAAGSVVHVAEGLVEVANSDGTDRVLVRPGKTASVAAAGGGKVQIGTTPQKSTPSKDKQSQGPSINRDLGGQDLDIEQSSKGLFKAVRDPEGQQTANLAGEPLGAENTLDSSLDSGLGSGDGGSDVSSGGAGNNGGGNSYGHYKDNNNNRDKDKDKTKTKKK